MVMSLGGEIATPVECGALSPAAEGIEQQAAIAALHHRLAQARQSHGPIAKVVGFPAALRHATAAEERFGDVPVARIFEARVERAQRENQAVASAGRQRRRVAPRRAAHQAAPEPQRRRRADLEKPVERQNNARRLRARRFDEVKAEQAAPPLDQPFCPFLRNGRAERPGIRFEVRVGEIGVSVC
jgi:hypothetical protein